jgi:hypothetical protein
VVPPDGTGDTENRVDAPTLRLARSSFQGLSLGCGRSGVPRPGVLVQGCSSRGARPGVVAAETDPTAVGAAVGLHPAESSERSRPRAGAADQRTHIQPMVVTWPPPESVGALAAAGRAVANIEALRATARTRARARRGRRGERDIALLLLPGPSGTKVSGPSQDPDVRALREPDDGGNTGYRPMTSGGAWFFGIVPRPLVRGMFGLGRVAPPGVGSRRGNGAGRPRAPGAGARAGSGQVADASRDTRTTPCYGSRSTLLVLVPFDRSRRRGTGVWEEGDRR